MRASLGASDTAFARTRALGFAAIAGASLAGCAHAAPRQPPDRQPPPHVLVVGLEQVALRTTAWVELHASLAAEGVYAKAQAGDDRDEQLARTAQALERCEDERCARAAVDGTPFAGPYLAALPGFLARDWTARAATARSAIELARAAMGPEVEPLVVELSQKLALDWPLPPPVVDVVTDAPAPGPEAPIRVLLSAHSPCFARSRGESERMHDARVVDCVLTYAALRLASRSALARAMSRELTARGIAGDLDRAWTALVVHAVAATVAAWEPRHASVLRRSAAAVMPEVMTWLAAEWPSRMRGESPDDFARRYAATLADAHSPVARPSP
jgi:hypothetical protein